MVSEAQRMKARSIRTGVGLVRERGEQLRQRDAERGGEAFDVGEREAI
jgi:hypothetical protein